MLASSFMVDTTVNRTCTKEPIRETVVDLEVAAGPEQTCMTITHKEAVFKSLMTQKNDRSTEKGIDATGVILTI